MAIKSWKISLEKILALSLKKEKLDVAISVAILLAISDICGEITLELGRIKETILAQSLRKEKHDVAISSFAIYDLCWRSRWRYYVGKIKEEINVSRVTKRCYQYGWAVSWCYPCTILALPWLSRHYLGFPWHFNGAILDLYGATIPWQYIGVSLPLQWLALRLPYPGATLALLWRYPGTTRALTWCYPGAYLVLTWC